MKKKYVLIVLAVLLLGSALLLWKLKSEKNTEKQLELKLQKLTQAKPNKNPKMSKLFLAIKAKNLSQVKALLNKENINKKNKQGFFTPLIYAFIKRDEKIIRYLIEQGADVNIEGVGGCTAVSYGANFGSIPIMKMMLKRGGDLNNTRCNFKSILFFTQNYEMFKFLVSKGADLQILNDFDQNVFHYKANFLGFYYAIHHNPKLPKHMLKKASKRIKNTKKILLFLAKNKIDPSTKAKMLSFSMDKVASFKEAVLNSYHQALRELKFKYSNIVDRSDYLKKEMDCFYKKLLRVYKIANR